MTDWVRLWHDMPTDPKWRVIARKSKQPLACVIATFSLMMVNASANADERGRLLNWDHEDAGAALDMDASDIEAIFDAMQGKVLDGDRLSGWEKRQPKREDNSATRVAKHRQTQSNAPKRDVTQRNAPETETETETDIPFSNENGAEKIDEDAQFWSDAKSYLKRRGVKNAGGMVGMWVRDHGKQATADAITRAQLERPPEVVAFVQGCFRHNGARAGAPIC